MRPEPDTKRITRSDPKATISFHHNNIAIINGTL